MRIKSKIYCFVLLLLLAGCADLVALPFGVADTTVWVATLGNVKMGTSSAVRGAVKHVTGEDERIAPSREALNARLEAARMKAEQEEEHKIKRAEYRKITEKIALIKDPDNYRNCLNTCTRYQHHLTLMDCMDRCAMTYANATDEEFRKYKAEMEKESQK